MKQFGSFVMFSVMYVLLILVFREIAGQDAEAEAKDVNGSGNPLIDTFAIDDPHTKTMLNIAYGTYHGDDQCRRKSACILGNYIRDLPGKDLMFIFLGGYVPPEYSLFYEIIRNSALYGQNCDVYNCIPQNVNNKSQAQVEARPRSI